MNAFFEAIAKVNKMQGKNFEWKWDDVYMEMHWSRKQIVQFIHLKYNGYFICDIANYNGLFEIEGKGICYTKKFNKELKNFIENMVAHFLIFLREEIEIDYQD